MWYYSHDDLTTCITDALVEAATAAEIAAETSCSTACPVLKKLECGRKKHNIASAETDSRGSDEVL